MSASQVTDLVKFQLCGVLFDLMEQMVVRGVKVVDADTKLELAIRHVYHQLETMPEDSGDPAKKLVLSTMGLLLDQCITLEVANSSYQKQIIEWRMTARQLDQSARGLVKAIHNFIIFAIHLNLIYPHNALTAQGVEFAITQAIVVDTPEAGNAAKRMMSALVTSKALWQIEHHVSCNLDVGPAEQLPTEVVDYLRVFYNKFVPLKAQSIPHRECVGPVPFETAFDWYLKSTRFVKPKHLPPPQQIVKDTVQEFFPMARTPQ